MSQTLGIDLGTTNSVVSICVKGKIETLFIEGKNKLPSVVSFKDEKNILIGEQAKKRIVIDPEHSVSSSKRYMGERKQIYEIYGHKYTPVDIASFILEKLVTEANKSLGYKDKEVKDVVITVPAYFNTNQKSDTLEAGKKAGLNVLGLIPEPTAAAISYGFDRGKDQTLMVYDLGGGTFDVTILEVKSNKFKVIAVDGDAHLGGDDFDNEIVKLLCKKFMEISGRDLLADKIMEARAALQRLKEEAEKAKCELSESKFRSCEIIIPGLMGYSFDYELTIQEYNKLIEPLLNKTLFKMKSAMKNARLTAGDIDRVILVGGSCRNEAVKEIVTAEIKEPFMADRVDEVVSNGAAIYSTSLYSPDICNIEVINVTGHNLGLRYSKGKETDLFNVLIKKNTPIPVKVEKEFSTYKDNQKSVEIAVFQGDGEKCSDNVFAGGFILDGIPSDKAGKLLIKVDFTMDKSDIIEVSASCKGTKKNVILDINKVSSIDELIYSKNSSVDIVFLIDTSGSMGSELDGMKKSCLLLSDYIIREGIDCRLGLVDFDTTSSFATYNTEVFPLTEPNRFNCSIDKLYIGRLGGYGCYIGDSNTVPVINTFVSSFQKNDRTRIGILISDEVSHSAENAGEIISILKKANIIMHVVGVPKSCHVNIAEQTKGKFWDIKTARSLDFSALLKDIASEICNLSERRDFSPDLSRGFFGFLK